MAVPVNTKSKKKEESSSSFSVRRLVQLGIVAGAVGLGILSQSEHANILKILSSDREYTKAELHVFLGGFCLSPIVPMLLKSAAALPGVRELNEKDVTEGEARVKIAGDASARYSFEETGNIGEDDYTVESIYSILYAMYKNAPKLKSPHGIEYQFTFNTWGIAPSPYPEVDPERHGKAAYAKLVTQKGAIEYMNQKTGSKCKQNVDGNGKTPFCDAPVSVFEVGCGTAAGANLITREVLPNATYLALDMQMAAINTCRERHATSDNKGLTCQQVPGGVGSGPGKNVPKPDNSADFAVISETHIADERIGDMEKEIFAEIHRVLKPGGLFLWGNALPTKIWLEGMDYLSKNGFELVTNTNHTEGAVVARDEDKDRVDMIITQLFDTYGWPVMTHAPFFGPRCRVVSEKLIANFYRHPGTALYLNMVTGFDSYMHQAWKKVDKAADKKAEKVAKKGGKK